MTGLVFVDTNVLVYARDPSERGKHEVADAWRASLWEAASGRLSAQVLSEFYNTVTRKISPGMSREDAAADVQAMSAWSPVPTTLTLIADAWRLEDRYQLSCWDSLIVAGAQRAKCRYLLSEDFQAGQDFDGVSVVDPFATAPTDLPV